jgi:hypothetical protein
MRKAKNKIVDVTEDDATTIQIEIDQSFIDFYKKETGRSRVTQKGLSDFCSNLVKIYQIR